MCECPSNVTGIQCNLRKCQRNEAHSIHIPGDRFWARAALEQLQLAPNFRQEMQVSWATYSWRLWPCCLCVGSSLYITNIYRAFSSRHISTHNPHPQQSYLIESNIHPYTHIRRINNVFIGQKSSQVKSKALGETKCQIKVNLHLAKNEVEPTGAKNNAMILNLR